MTQEFAFKELTVWSKSIDFACAIIELTENLNSSKNHFKLIEQIEASAASIAQNIAEGKGRYSKKEFKHFLYIARGSLYETITLLVIFERLNWITNDKRALLEENAFEIARMIKGLINKIDESM